MKKAWLFAPLLLVTSLLTGCISPTPVATKGVESILIVPAVNETDTVGASLLMTAVLPTDVVDHKGYYALPVNTVKMVLENEGLFDPHEIRSLGPQKLAQMFHADAVLFVTVKDWDSQYLLVTSKRVVSTEFELYKSDGELLAKDSRTFDQLSNSFISVDVLGAVINTATAAYARLNASSPVFEELAKENAFRSTVIWEHGFLHKDPKTGKTPW